MHSTQTEWQPPKRNRRDALLRDPIGQAYHYCTTVKPEGEG